MANNVPAFENSIPKNYFEKLGWGCYPPGYDRKVHGPYNPGTYYGPKDTPLAEVKMSELAQWIGRRNKTPRAFCQMVARAYFRWNHKFELPRKAGFAPILQLMLGSVFVSYCLHWKTTQHHKNHKYHW